MTNQEFKNEFNIHYNAIASMSAPAIDDYEISVYLTKAQLELVKNYYTTNGNKYKTGFEDSEKRRIDLKELIDHYSSTVKLLSTKHISPNSVFFRIPNDVFLIIYESAIISTENCLNNSELNVVVKTHDEYNIQNKNPFKRPDKNTIWRIDYSKLNDEFVAELISDYEINEYKIRYLKYPEPIIISDLNTNFPGENLSIDGLTNENSCKLNQEIHREIIDRAVELALRDYKTSNLESKIQLDVRNE